MQMQIKTAKRRVLAGSMAWASLWVLLACSLVFPQSSKAEQEIVTGQTTTGNLVGTDLNTYTREGKTFIGPTGQGCSTGEFCTGGKEIGGKFSTTFNLQNSMTLDNINRGFTLDSGVDVSSHISNVTVPNCVTMTQASPDCKDSFSLTISLYNSQHTTGTAIHTFVHQVELDFSGARSFLFQDLIPANEFSFMTGEFSLFGIDAGFGSNAFGPQFSNPTMTSTFDVVSIIQDVIIDVIEEMVLPEFTVPITNIEVEINNSTVEANAPMPPMQIAEIQTVELQAPVMVSPVQTTTVEQIAEVATTASVEQEMEVVNEPTNEQPVESTVTNGPEPSEEGGTNSATTENEDADNGSTDSGVRRGPPAASADEPEEAQTESASVKKPTAKQKIAKKRAAKQKVAKKIMKRMGDKGKYDSTNQVRQLVVMQVLGNTRSFFNVSKIIPDTPGFFNETKIPDTSISDNNYSAYILFGGSDVAHDALTASQYRR